MLKILIVDNEAVIRRGVAACMNWEEQGATIVGQAVDGIDALEKIEQQKPDVVISDIRMPGMDGLALAAELARRNSGIQVIILTGYPDFSYAQKAISFGVVDFVLKPTNPDELIVALDSAKKRIYQQNQQDAVNRRLEVQEKQNIQLQRSLFLNELIHTREPDAAPAQKECRRLQLYLDAYYVLRVHVSLPLGTPEDAQSVQEDSLRILEDMLGGIRYTHIQRAGQYSYYVVEEQNADRLLAVCRRAAEAADSLLYCPLTIGISKLHHHPKDLFSAAQQARQAQQFGAYSDASAAVAYNAIPAASAKELETITRLLQALRSAIESGRLQDTLALLQSTFAAMRAARLPMQEVHKIASFAVHFCVDNMFAVHEPQSLAKMPTTQKVLESETVDSMEQSLQDYIVRMMQLNAASPDERVQTVTTIKNYVLKHYNEPLTLEALSKIVYLSPSYLSKLFKRETGENISSYIQEARIHKAKELLRGTQLKNYEVAERVGIPDPVYFARMFKRITGKKPKDYRASNEFDSISFAPKSGD